MTSDALLSARQKMADAGVGQAAIQAFSHYFELLAQGHTGIVRESEISPLTDVERLDDVTVSDDAAADAMSVTAFIKLNGGLGTSMGLDGPKSLLPVRDDVSFLDLVVRQVLFARKRFHVRLPLVFMNSFATRPATLEALKQFPELDVGLPLDFVQSAEPKLEAKTLEPVSWPRRPELEWCPAGHGDIYPSLLDSGVLDALIDQGYRYAAVSNSDNLGAAPDPRLAGWFAATGAPFAAEVCRRTVNDRKGGHLARRNSDGHVILRESAQTADEDQQFFTDESRHAFFNTNNLWLDLRAIREALKERDGVLGLPLIRNEKTVDPRDPRSTRVIQIETAMGAAIEVFRNAAVIEVGRDRFVPVKKTNELLLLRSDCYEVDANSGILSANVPAMPAIDLDPRYFGLLPDFERRAGHVPSLRRARSLKVRGDVTFGPGNTVVGDAVIDAEEPLVLAQGETIGAE